MLTIAGGIILAVIVLAYWEVLLVIALHVLAIGTLLLGIAILVIAASGTDPDAMRFGMGLGALLLVFGVALCWEFYFEPLWERWREKKAAKDTAAR